MRVALAEDHEIWRAGLRSLLNQMGIEVTVEAANADEFLDQVREDPPDVAIVDIRMPISRGGEPTPEGGLGATARLRSEHPDVGILVLSQHSNHYYLERLLSERGKRIGYYGKNSVMDAGVLRWALDTVAAGRPCIDGELVEGLRHAETAGFGRLTKAELRAVQLVADGLGNKKVAETLFITEGVVEKHLTQAYGKLGLAGSDTHRRVSLVLAYLKWTGQLQTPEET